MRIISEMQHENIEQVYAIECDCFETPWSLEALHQEVDYEKAIYLIMSEHDKVLGYCGLWKIIDEGHITNIAVHKAYRSQGIGRKLVSTLMEVGFKQGINRFTLEVRKSNKQAINMYEDLGFSRAGIRKKYYEKPKEDAIIMWK